MKPRPDPADLLDALADLIADRVADRLANRFPEPAPVPTQDEEQLIDIGQAAGLLSLATSTLYKRRDIPRVKLGGKVLYRRGDLLAWVKAQQQNPTPGLELEDWDRNG